MDAIPTTSAGERLKGIAEAAALTLLMILMLALILPATLLMLAWTLTAPTIGSALLSGFFAVAFGTYFPPLCWMLADAVRMIRENVQEWRQETRARAAAAEKIGRGP